MWIVYIHNTCYFCKTNVANNPPRYTLAIKWCANWCTALHGLRAYMPFCAICLGRFCLNHRITHDQWKTANWPIIIMRSCYKPSLMRLLMFKSIIQINTLPFQFDANNACWMCSKTNFFLDVPINGENPVSHDLSLWCKSNTNKKKSMWINMIAFNTSLLIAII